MQLTKYSWGGTAAIITSMGMVAGLNYAEHARAAIIGGLLIIAIADNITDSLSIHIYKETETADSAEVLSTTMGNFLSRLVITFSFILLTLVLPLATLVYVSTAWGLALLAGISVLVSRIKRTHWLREVAIHLAIAVVVVAISKYLGFIITKYIA